MNNILIKTTFKDHLILLKQFHKFYTKYLKVLASILKHQNKIENGKIEIVQLVKSPHGSGYALKNENSNFE